MTVQDYYILIHNSYSQHRLASPDNPPEILNLSFLVILSFSWLRPPHLPPPTEIP